MAISNEDQKEIWTPNKIIEELHYNLISIKGENGLRKYEQQAKFLLYRISIWDDSQAGDQQASAFTVELEDISEKVKEQIASVLDDKFSRIIVKESISQLFENLGPKEKEYFNKNVRHLLKVRFV